MPNGKRVVLPIAVAASVWLAGCQQEEPPHSASGGFSGDDVLSYVDPFIGTGGSGHTFPGAVAPQGMVQLSPDTTLTGWDSASGYYDDGKTTKNIPVYGFSHTHFSGTGITDLGDILLLPYSNSAQADLASFDKSSEYASPGYYRMTLKKSDIKVELTASPRVGVHRYTFPADSPRSVKIDLGHTLEPEVNSSQYNELEIVDDYTIRGRRLSSERVKNQDIYFYATFSAPIKNSKIQYGLSQAASTGVYTGEQVRAYLDFEKSDEPLVVKVALSPTGVDGAEGNLAEIGTGGFDKVRTDTENLWRDELSVITVEGGTDVEKTNFYTAMYHSQMMPMVYEDLDGLYNPMYGGDDPDGNKPNADSSDLPNYTIYSLWDSYRAWHPLQSIIYPQRAENYANDLIRKQQDGGLLPKWEAHSRYTGVMIGHPATIVIADAINKGFEVKANEALDAAVVSSTYDPEAFRAEWGDTIDAVMTPQLGYYEDDGYVGWPNWNSTSNTLEFAIGDGAIAEIAEAAGNSDVAATYTARSQSYKIHWQDGFLQPVDLETDDFLPDFDPYKVDGFWYTEGNAWQWKWSAMHDIDGLIELIGGKAELTNDLDELFTAEEGEDGADLQDMSGFIGQYVHGNEPSHHVAYLYSRSDTPWQGQYYLDRIMDEFYTNEPNGLIGNEDVGQMSAWYILSAMGFYQINPFDPTFTIGRPLFDKATIQVEGGQFTIVAENNGPDNIYVQEVTINGNPLGENYTFTYEDIKSGGELRFVMGSKPNKEL